MIEPVHLSTPRGGAICDFCSSPDVHWSYPARDFTHHRELAALTIDMRTLETERHDIDLDAGSSGGWAACNVCHALIERGARERLARRSAKRMLRIHGMNMSLRDALGLIRPFQDTFWANREGEPVYSADRPRKDPTRE